MAEQRRRRAAGRDKETAPAGLKHAVSRGVGSVFPGCTPAIQSLRLAMTDPPGQEVLIYTGVSASCEEQKGSLNYTGQCTRAEPMGRETKWRAAV